MEQILDYVVYFIAGCAIGSFVENYIFPGFKRKKKTKEEELPDEYPVYTPVGVYMYNSKTGYYTRHCEDGREEKIHDGVYRWRNKN